MLALAEVPHRSWQIARPALWLRLESEWAHNFESNFVDRSDGSLYLRPQTSDAPVEHSGRAGSLAIPSADRATTNIRN